MHACPQAAGAFAKGLQQIDGLQLAGSPAMTVVAFRAAKPRRLNIYALNDLMSQRGWHLSALQLPPALHMCFTAQHASIVDSLLKVLLATLCMKHRQLSADLVVTNMQQRNTPCSCTQGPSTPASLAPFSWHSAIMSSLCGHSTVMHSYQHKYTGFASMIAIQHHIQPA